MPRRNFDADGKSVIGVSRAIKVLTRRRDYVDRKALADALTGKPCSFLQEESAALELALALLEAKRGAP